MNSWCLMALNGVFLTRCSRARRDASHGREDGALLSFGVEVRFSFIATLAFLSQIGVTPGAACAQGITTAAIHGIVQGGAGIDVDGASVRVINASTGYVTETKVRGGSFLVRGLATGGPYHVVVTKVGYTPQVADRVLLSLGEELQLQFTLTALATNLDTVRVAANHDRASRQSAGGVGTSISDSSLRRLPTLNRDLYDFVRLVPQVSTRFGLSAGGANFRYNGYMIDGVSDRQLQGNNVMGAGPIGGKTISLEAVKEYQVLLSPYSARYGDFSGMLVNAVTKSGTNEFRGSAYGYARNEQLARSNSFVGSSPYRREQYGMSIGGPVIRDRLHFFIAPEFQHSSAPTPGPYIGQAFAVSPAPPVSEADVTRLGTVLGAKGLNAGDGGRVIGLNPATTLFGRLDLAIPEWKSRVVLLENYSSVDVTRFSRPNGGRVFPLSSNAWTLQTEKHSSAVQIFTQTGTSIFNELLAAYMDRPVAAGQYTRSPSIQVVVPGANGVQSATLIAGPPAAAGGTGSTQIIAEIGDHLVFKVGSRHTLGAGVHVESFRYHAIGVRGILGEWKFPSLDALANGDASSYSISRDFGTATSGVRGMQPSAYVSDEWSVGDRLSLTLGLRADALDLFGVPVFNPAIDSVFGRRTSDYPKTHVQWSPRIGFTLRPFADQQTSIRGGAGIFVASPPLGWLLGPVRSNGIGVRTLSCNVTPGLGKAPKFVADPDNQPQMCADGRGFSDGPVALVDRNLQMAESFRASLAIDRHMPWYIDATVEGLYSRVRSDFLFVNANLAGPQGVDAHGRVMYGTIDPFGRTQPAVLRGRRFPEVIDLRNHSRGHSWSVTTQVTRPFSDRAQLRASYTHSRSRDVQSLTNASAVAPFDIWAGGRPLFGQQDVLSTGISAFEVAHRIVLAATFVAPWRRWKTDVSLYYIGESGSPFTFGDSTSNGMGDLNADGTSANDPIYVPRDATNSSEIAFSGSDSVAQGAAFEQFIRHTSCLQGQRGTIVERNSCRGPWVHTSNASLRQSLPTIGGHDISMQVEVFNVLNLLNSSWGLFRVPNQWILEHVGQTKGLSPQPLFRFNSANVSSTQNLESGYQLQLSLRFSF